MLVICHGIYRVGTEFMPIKDPVVRGRTGFANRIAFECDKHTGLTAYFAPIQRVYT